MSVTAATIFYLHRIENSGVYRFSEADFKTGGDDIESSAHKEQTEEAVKSCGDFAAVGDVRIAPVSAAEAQAGSDFVYLTAGISQAHPPS